MLTTSELTDRTGLSVKTLGRWSAKGILPKPRVETHPSGRGKVGFWPTWTADLCIRINALRAEGIGLEEATATAYQDRYLAVDAEFRQQAEEEIHGRKWLKTPDGREWNLIEMLRGLLAQAIRASMLKGEAQRSILTQLEKDEFISKAIHLIQVGYHVFLAFDGQRIGFVPDFLLYGASGDAMKAPKSFFSLPLTPLYHEILRNLGLARLVEAPVAAPAHKVWMTEKERVVEYPFFPGGEFGFVLPNIVAANVVAEVREDGQKYYVDPRPAYSAPEKKRQPCRKRKSP